MNRILLLSLAALLAACGRQPAESPQQAPTAHYKTGHGVSLPEPMRKSLGIETTDVVEKAFVPRIEVPLHVLRDGEAAGWLTKAQAGAVRPGQPVRLSPAGAAPVTGTVRAVQPAPFATLGDFEVTVALDKPLPAGTGVVGAFEGAPTGEVLAVPRSAVLKTAEGEFVYVANEDYFARTPVKTAARNDNLVEVVDGLFSGDQVVSAQVTPLWMTELQALRAGKSCCAGH
jgi:hypothetical protein